MYPEDISLKKNTQQRCVIREEETPADGRYNQEYKNMAYSFKSNNAIKDLFH